MEYQIQRGDQKFGPYSLAELQQYVQEGRVLLTDLAQSEGMSDWVPVSQILGNIPIPAPAQVLASPPQDLIPLPPNPDAMLKQRAMLLATNVKSQVRECTDLPNVANQLQGTAGSTVTLWIRSRGDSAPRRLIRTESKISRI